MDEATEDATFWILLEAAMDTTMTTQLNQQILSTCYVQALFQD